jgi:hypothetical protein
MKVGKVRLGNWVVTKSYRKGVPFIKVAPVSGEFSWEYSGMDEMFAMIEGAVDTPDSHVGLQTCLGMMGAFIHVSDPVFYDLYLKCLEEYGKIAEMRKPATQEDEREIIEQMRISYEISSELRVLSDEL